MIDLSIAVPSWNTRDLLDQCLASVYSSIGNLNHEAIVVDNASADGSAEMVAEKYTHARLIRSRVNLGFAAACNIAFKYSTGRYFLLLNTDVVVLNNALEAMVQFMDQHPDAGAVGCKLLNPDGTLQRSCGRFPTPLTELFDALYLSKLFPKSRVFGCYAMSHWDFDEVREVDFVGGSCLTVRREAVEQIGLLDEGYFMYTEEADWCYRLWRRGWAVYYFPGAQVIHMGGQSASKHGGDMLLRLYITRHRFIRKHQGLAAATAQRGIVALGSICRLAAYPLGLLSSRPARDIRRKLDFQWKLLKWAATGRLIVTEQALTNSS